MFSLTRLLLALVSVTFALAQDGMIGEIKLWPVNFAPQGWAFCEGQLLPINQNTALFSLLGTTYGGDGRTNFALPDLRGRFPVGRGQSPNNNNNFALGQTGGSTGGPAQVTGFASGAIPITVDNLPTHSHTAAFSGSQSTSNFNVPLTVAQASGGAVPQPNGFLSQGAGTGSGQAFIYQPSTSTANKVTLNGGTGQISTTPQGEVTLDNTGGGQPLQATLGLNAQVNVQQPPFLALNYIIALQGYFPQRD